MKIEQHSLFTHKTETIKAQPPVASKRIRPQPSLKLGLNKIALKEEGMLLLRMLQSSSQSPKQLLYIIRQEIKLKKGITSPDLTLMDVFIRLYAR